MLIRKCKNSLLKSCLKGIKGKRETVQEVLFLESKLSFATMLMGHISNISCNIIFVEAKLSLHPLDNFKYLTINMLCIEGLQKN